MKSFFDVQISELFKELETDVISIVNQSFDVITEDSDLFLERLCLLSGISKERLAEIQSYNRGDEAICEGVVNEDDFKYNREGCSESKSPELSVMEIHSLCNAISLSLVSVNKNEKNPAIDDLVDRCDSIINKWGEKMNDYFNRSNDIFDNLVAASEVSSPEEFFSSYHIFMDSTALCDENMAEILSIIIPEIKHAENSLKITVPNAVVNCLQTMAKDEEKNLLFGADEGLRNLFTIQKEGLLSVRGDGADTTIMSIFLSAFSRFKPVYKMLLVTQDETLANAVQMLNTSGVEGAEIMICKLSETNGISLWFSNELIDTMDTDNTGEDEEAALRLDINEETSDKEQQVDAKTDDDEVLKKDTMVVGIDSVEDSYSEENTEACTKSSEIPDREENFSQEEVVDSFFGEEYSIDNTDGQLDQATINEAETDIEKMSMLEEQLANMLGKSVISSGDEDDELSDDDDFDDKPDSSNEKDDEDLDFSEDDTLIADAFESDSWSILD